jgi:hypothetical protein
MADYFDRIELQLRDAVGRTARPRWWTALRMPRTHRGVALAIAFALVGGSAATAALLIGQAGLAGRVPPSVLAPRNGAALAYRVSFAPNLTPGNAGWAGGVELGGHARPLPLSFAAALPGSYPTIDLPIDNLSRWLFYWDRRTHTELQGLQSPVEAFLTAGDVAAVRFDHEVVRTRVVPGLPAGDRLAVIFETHAQLANPGPVPVAGVSRPPQAPLLSALAANGRTLPAHVVPDHQSAAPLRPQIIPWGPSNYDVEKGYTTVYPATPVPGVCAFASPAIPGLEARAGATIDGIEPVRDAEGEALLSCVETAYTLHGSELVAAVLVNGNHPGRRPGSIPGAQPVRGAAGVVNLALGATPAGITGRMVDGRAWIVVEGGTGIAQRLELLRALRVTRLDLSPWKLDGAGHDLLSAQSCIHAAGGLTTDTGSITDYPYTLTVSHRVTAIVAFYDSAAEAQDDYASELSLQSSESAVSVDRDGAANISWIARPNAGDRAFLQRCLR